MSQLDPLMSFTKMQKGQRVDRDLAIFTGTSSTPIFTIAGGRVRVTQILGEITTGASNTTNIQLQSNPTTGTTAVCSLVLAAGALEVGTLLGITGVVGDAMYGVSAGLATGQKQDIILPAGALELTVSASGVTISIKWSVFYTPIDDGATIVVA